MVIDLGWLDERVQDTHMGGHTPGGSHVEVAAVLVYQRVSGRHGGDDRRLGRRRRVGGWAELLHRQNPTERLHPPWRRPLRHRPDEQGRQPVASDTRIR